MEVPLFEMITSGVAVYQFKSSHNFCPYKRPLSSSSFYAQPFCYPRFTVKFTIWKNVSGSGPIFYGGKDSKLSHFVVKFAEEKKTQNFHKSKKNRHCQTFGRQASVPIRIYNPTLTRLCFFRFHEF
jgi:hypothetical protein